MSMRCKIDVTVDAIIKKDNSDWKPTQEQIKKDIYEINDCYAEMRVLLTKSSPLSQCFSIREDNGKISAIKPVSLEASISAFSLKTRLDSSKNHPDRIIGTLLLPSTLRDRLSPLIFKINVLKLLFKKRINNSVTKYNDRVNLLRAVVPSLLVQSVYRKIHEAPVNTYRINYSWSDKSRSVKYISYSEVKDIFELHAEEMIVNGAAVGMTKEKLIENDKLKLTATGFHKQYVIVKPIKVFPQQTYNYRNEDGDRIRVVIKATTPLICYFDNVMDIIHKTPKEPTRIGITEHNKYIPVIPERNLYFCRDADE